MISIAVAAVLLIPASLKANAGSAPALTSQPEGSVDVSSAKKKKPRKAAKQEQYLRAVPSTPPPGTKM
jgi:hypothetical protein